MAGPSGPTRRGALTMLTAGGVAAFAGGRASAQSPVVDVRRMGARGDGVTDDTRALMRAAAALNDAGSGQLYFPRGTYLIGQSTLGDLPDRGWKRAVEATTKGSPDSGVSVGLILASLRSFSVRGDGAVLKRRDNSCPAQAGPGRMALGVLNLVDCQDFEITGLFVDGNRYGQHHTRGRGFGTANHGLKIWSDCRGGRIHGNGFARSGTLTSAADKAGDDIYCHTGVSDMSIYDNDHEDWGRWAVTLTGSSPPATAPTNGFTVSGNRFRANPQGQHLGAIDIEPWQPANDVRIADNRMWGRSKVSVGSAPVPAEQVVRGLRIEGNVWDYTGLAAPSSETIILIAGRWTGRSGRTYRDTVVRNNSLQLGPYMVNRFCSLVNAGFDGFAFTDNQVSAPADIQGVSTQALLAGANVVFDGVIDIERNSATAMGYLMRFDSWGPVGRDDRFQMTVLDNAVGRAPRGLVLAFRKEYGPDSTVLIDRNRVGGAPSIKAGDVSVTVGPQNAFGAP